MKKKSREWKIRLSEEIRHNTNGIFVTLTFNNESLSKYEKKIEGTPETKPNAIATEAVRHFLERWRKKYKKSVKHWLITELGHKGTERIHLHGIIFTSEKKYIEKIWQNGWVYLGQYVNEKTINYIVKYVTKIDTDHKWFTGKILCSPGIGGKYISRPDSINNKYKPETTNELYKTRTGTKLALPIYYRNKIYNPIEREQLWIEKLNKQERYVCGEKIDISTPEGVKNYENCRDYYRTINQKLGYGKTHWNEKKYVDCTKKIEQITKNSKNNINIEQNNSDLTPNTNF